MTLFNGRTRRWVLSSGMALAIWAAGFSAQAEDSLVVNMLGKSAGLISDVQHYCPPRRAAEGIAGYNFKTDEIYLDENFGAATPYKITSPTFKTARTTENQVAIMVSNLTPRNLPNCSAIIVLNSDKEKARIKQSFRDGDYKKHLPSSVSDEIDRLYAWCKGLGRKASSYFLLGSYVLSEEDGHVSQISDFFFCESGVMTSVSSIDVTLKGSTIRIASVYNKIFLLEVTK